MENKQDSLVLWSSAPRSILLLVHVTVSFAKYGTLTALTIFGHKQSSQQGLFGRQSFWQCLACLLCVTTFSPHLWIYMPDIVFGQLHLLMLGTELEVVPADTVSFELCIYSYLRASCVHSDRVCRLYSFIINVLLLFECHWSHSLQILLHVRNNTQLISMPSTPPSTLH